jgi:hypothetical protein
VETLQIPSAVLEATDDQPIHAQLDQLTYRLSLPLGSTQLNQHLQTEQGLARIRGVQRPETSVVSRGEGQQEILRFRAADFADGQSLGSHSETLPNQVRQIHFPELR